MSCGNFKERKAERWPLALRSYPKPNVDDTVRGKLVPTSIGGVLSNNKEKVLIVCSSVGIYSRFHRGRGFGHPGHFKDLFTLFYPAHIVRSDSSMLQLRFHVWHLEAIIFGYFKIGEHIMSNHI